MSEQIGKRHNSTQKSSIKESQIARDQWCNSRKRKQMKNNGIWKIEHMNDQLQQLQSNLQRKTHKDKLSSVLERFKDLRQLINDPVMEVTDLRANNNKPEG